MIILRDSLKDAYVEIRRSSSNSCPVFIFVTPECDSVCALQILTSLFRSDHITYKVTPVAGYDDLYRANEAFEQDRSEIHSIVLINCGATVELQRFFSLDETTKIYVIDSRRPYHLANVRETNDQIVLFDDKRLMDEYPSDDELSSSDEDSDSLDDVGPMSERRQDIRNKREETQARLTAYYHGTYFETAAATICFELAEQLEKNDREMLWCGICGLTDQHIHRRISPHKYESDVDRYITAVLYEADPAEGELKPLDDSTHENQVSILEDGAIGVEHKEYAFFLFRHWSLFESMRYSRGVAVKLSTWTESGKNKLHMILAKIGIPLKESTMTYNVMDQDCKQRLRDQLVRYASEYGLDERDLFYTSFTRKFGKDMTLSASDMVYAICGLLENTEHSSSPIWHNAFWNAHDSIKSCNSAMTREGLHLSIELQQEVIRYGNSLLTKPFQNCGRFRLCIWKTPGGNSRFTHPFALCKLAFFLIDAYESRIYNSRKRQRDSGSKVGMQKKAFVMCSFIEERGTFLVVGLPREDQHNSIYRNQFSTGFSEAAENTRARVKQDGFEASFVEVQKDDLTSFIQNLTKLIE